HCTSSAAVPVLVRRFEAAGARPPPRTLALQKTVSAGRPVPGHCQQIEASSPAHRPGFPIHSGGSCQHTSSKMFTLWRQTRLSSGAIFHSIRFLSGGTMQRYLGAFVLAVVSLSFAASA